MLSAYELSNGTFPVLVKQAQTLADRLTSAWFNVREPILRAILTLKLTDLRRETAFPMAASKSTLPPQSLPRRILPKLAQ